MNPSFNKKRRPQPVAPSRTKQSKGPSKSTVEDLFPFEAPFLQTLAPEIKQYVSELQRQYIQRYNILMNNRMIYEQIVEKQYIDRVGLKRSQCTQPDGTLQKQYLHQVQK